MGFELEGDHDLAEFAGDAFFRSEKEAAGELHSEGRAAALLVVADDVFDSTFGDAEVVDSAVLEEAAVFDGGDGLDHARGDFAVGDEAALGAVFIFGEGGDELGFEGVAAEGDAIFGGDGLDDAASRVDGGSVGGMVALGAWLDEDVVSVELEGAECRVAVVSSLPEVAGDGGCGEGLSGADFLGCGVDLGDVGEDGTGGETVVDDFLVFEVEVAENGCPDEETAQGEDERVAEQACAEALLRCFGASAVSVFQFDRHEGWCGPSCWRVERRGSRCSSSGVGRLRLEIGCGSGW